jgi:hypothetical protein
VLRHSGIRIEEMLELSLSSPLCKGCDGGYRWGSIRSG